MYYTICVLLQKVFLIKRDWSAIPNNFKSEDILSSFTIKQPIEINLFIYKQSIVIIVYFEFLKF